MTPGLGAGDGVGPGEPGEPEGPGEEAPPVGVSFSQVTENSSHGEVTRAGPRTSNRTASSRVAPARWPASTWSTCRVVAPLASYERSCQRGSDPSADPPRVTQRYSNPAGTRATSTVPVKAGASTGAGGQLPA
ncbi:hypothetical protein ACFWBH_09375 [Streptomyces sp. NPDC059999]|uniref:hypothetical protein n=1 Tax=Streptomyces sp. NPDC059999 TaxID=3347030 RepID=UPI0036AF002E